MSNKANRTYRKKKKSKNRNNMIRKSRDKNKLKNKKRTLRRKLIKAHKKPNITYTINPLKYHSRDPEIFTIDDFISNSDCEHIKNLAKPLLKRAVVSGDKKGYISEHRTNSNCWINKKDKIVSNIIKRIADLVELPEKNAESMQVIYYDKNQQYKNHYDGWDQDNSVKSKRLLENGGQRLKTVLCYLNDVGEGGETEFPQLKLKIKPEKKKLIAFSNVYPGTNKKHLKSEHCGCPIKKGKKWAFNVWFRERENMK